MSIEQAGLYKSKHVCGFAFLHKFFRRINLGELIPAATILDSKYHMKFSGYYGIMDGDLISSQQFISVHYIIHFVLLFLLSYFYMYHDICKISRLFNNVNLHISVLDQCLRSVHNSNLQQLPPMSMCILSGISCAYKICKLYINQYDPSSG